MAAGKELDCCGQILRALAGDQHSLEMARRRKRQPGEEGSEHRGGRLTDCHDANTAQVIESEDVLAIQNQVHAADIRDRMQRAVEGTFNAAVRESLFEDSARDLLKVSHERPHFVG
jgi:hypothetical protein